MTIFGLIGTPLDHSWSESYFTQKFKDEALHDLVYRNYPLHAIGEFNALLRQVPELKGLNVTMPYKEAVMALLDVTESVCHAVRACNTVVIRRESGHVTHLAGYNTDITGFSNSIRPLLKKHHRKALVLGTGGAARTVSHVLGASGIEAIMAGRHPKDNMISLDGLVECQLGDFQVIVNATPLGQKQHPGNPLPDVLLKQITANHLCYDLVYNPPLTDFLKQAGMRGAATKNGLEMLYLQAEASWKIWKQYL
ncbi:MAG TPA: shikimate dehydrogenase [Bacteroidales bacterium]|nr:shikimate dehydrogenase [Bacteroidales bacterium]HSA42604.1 shikimate dehydrogenase [Bacteroidales bacterium]